MDFSSTKLVRPFSQTENSLLELLVSDFTLRRRNHGSELKIRFDDNTLAIGQREGKAEVQRAMMPDFTSKALKYQKRLDAYLLESQDETLNISDPGFVFRYASGGTLPIIRVNKKEYYCFFYREIFPMGWNIANGASDTRNELLHPTDTIDRELREELIMIDRDNKRRYSFKDDLGKPLDHPQFSVARRFWKERFHKLNLSEFDEFPINLKWLEGPDCLTVQYAEDEAITTGGYFLNINALDFGIEVDKVVKINLDQELPGKKSSITLLDGEIIGGHLVDAPVGLFEVDRLNQEIEEGKTEFFPDYFFHSARRHDGPKFLNEVKNSFIPYVSQFINKKEIENWQRSKKKYDLCPITRRIIKRYTSLKTDTPAFQKGKFDVFLSSAGEDAAKTEQVYNYLMNRQIKTFFSRETIGDPDYQRAINDAIDSSKHLVAVGTKLRHITKPWVGYECTAFQNNILSLRNPKGYMFPFIVPDIDPNYLPLPLRVYNSIPWEQQNMTPGLETLVRHIKAHKG
jgi:hypothetical protein